ncbi:MAG: hypothetical protein ACPGN3_10420 [Opitutales bacterium]
MHRSLKWFIATFAISSASIFAESEITVRITNSGNETVYYALVDLEYKGMFGKNFKNSFGVGFGDPVVSGWYKLDPGALLSTYVTTIHGADELYIAFHKRGGYVKYTSPVSNVQGKRMRSFLVNPKGKFDYTGSPESSNYVPIETSFGVFSSSPYSGRSETVTIRIASNKSDTVTPFKSVTPTPELTKSKVRISYSKGKEKLAHEIQEVLAKHGSDVKLNKIGQSNWEDGSIIYARSDASAIMAGKIVNILRNSFPKQTFNPKSYNSNKKNLHQYLPPSFDLFLN